MEYKDFIDFKFGDNWASDFNLVAVSNGDRYATPFYGTVTPSVTSVPGKDGVYHWNNQVGEKVFTIDIAYDNVTLEELKRIKTWLNPHETKKLIFKEEPYKYYWATLQSEPQISFLPFRTEDKIVNGVRFKKGVYKGELVLTFICIKNDGYSEWSGMQDGVNLIETSTSGINEVSLENAMNNKISIDKIQGHSEQKSTRYGKANENSAIEANEDIIGGLSMYGKTIEKVENYKEINQDTFFFEEEVGDIPEIRLEGKTKEINTRFGLATQNDDSFDANKDVIPFIATEGMSKQEGVRIGLANANQSTFDSVNTKTMNFSILGKSEQKQDLDTPTPEKPSGINAVGQSRNLYDNSIVNFNGENIPSFVPRKSIASVNDTGKSIYTLVDASTIAIAYINLKKNTPYTLSQNSNYNVYYISVAEAGQDLKTNVQYLNRYSTTIQYDYDFVLAVIYRAQDGSDFTDESLELLKNSIQIEEGNDLTPYKKYNQSSVEIVSKGRNLFDKSNKSMQSLATTNTTQENITYSSGTNAVVIPCKPNTTYTLTKTIGVRFTASYCSSYPMIGTATEGYVNASGQTELKITTGPNAKYLYSYVFSTGLDTEYTFEEILDTIQIEEGDSASAYEAYQEKRMSFNLNNPLYGLENYQDTLSQGINGNYSITRKIIKYDALTDFNPYVQVEDEETLYINLRNTTLKGINQAPILCNVLPEKIIWQTDGVEGVSYEGSVSDHSIRIRIKKDRLNGEITGEAVAQWLIDNNVEFYTVRAEFLEEEVEIDEVKINKGRNSFTVEDAIDADFSLNYIKENQEDIQESDIITPTTYLPINVQSVGESWNLFNKDGVNFNSINGVNNFIKFKSTVNGAVGGNIYVLKDTNARCLAYFNMDVTKSYHIKFDNSVTQIERVAQADEEGLITDVSIKNFFKSNNRVGLLIFRKRDMSYFSESQVESLKNSLQITETVFPKDYKEYNNNALEFKTVGSNLFSQKSDYFYTNDTDGTATIILNINTGKCLKLNNSTKDSTWEYDYSLGKYNDFKDKKITFSSIINSNRNLSGKLKLVKYNLKTGESTLLTETAYASISTKVKCTYIPVETDSDSILLACIVVSTYTSEAVEVGDLVNFYEMNVTVHDKIYDEYEELRTQINLENPLRSLPNGVKDVFKTEGNKVTVIRKVGYDKINATSIVTLTNGTNGTKRFGVYDSSKFTSFNGEDLEVYCTHYKAIPYTRSSALIEGVCTTASGYVVISTNSTKITLEEIQQFFTENDVYIQYILKTPVISTYTISTPSTLEGINNFTLLDNQEIEYQIYYNKQEQDIADSTDLIAPFPEYDASIKGVGANYNLHSLDFSDYTIGTYGYVKLGSEPGYTIRLIDKNPTVDLIADNVYLMARYCGDYSPLSFGRSLIQSGVTTTTEYSSPFVKYLSFHPATQEVFNKINQKYDIQITKNLDHKAFLPENKKGIGFTINNKNLYLKDNINQYWISESLEFLGSNSGNTSVIIEANGLNLSFYSSLVQSKLRYYSFDSFKELPEYGEMKIIQGTSLDGRAEAIISNNKKYVLINFGDATAEIQIEYSEKTNHSPYKLNDIAIPINNELLSSPSGVTDSIIVNPFESLITTNRKNKKTILSGVENWSIFEWENNPSVETIAFYTTISDMKKTDGTLLDIVCNRFQVVANTEEKLALDGETILHDITKRVVLRIRKDRLTELTVESFRTWLGNNPVELQYELENPIIENEITNLSDFHTYTKNKIKIANEEVQGYNLLIKTSEANGEITTPFPGKSSELNGLGKSYNLFDKNNYNELETQIDYDGSILSYLPGEGSVFYIPCKPNMTYSVTKITDGSLGRLRLGYTSNKPDYNTRLDGINATTSIYSSKSIITTDENARYLCAYVWTSVSNVSKEEVYNSLMVVEGVDTLEYMSSDEKAIVINNKGRNLLKNMNAPTTDSSWWYATTGIHSVESDGWIRFAYTNNSTSYNWIQAWVNKNHYDTDFKPNTSYKFIVEFKNLSSIRKDGVLLSFGTTESIWADTKTINKNDLVNNKIEFSLTTKNSFEDELLLLRPDILVNSDTAVNGYVNYYFRISIYEDAEIDAYEDCSQQLVKLPLNEEFAEANAVVDRAQLINQKLIVQQKTETLYLNGSENWIAETVVYPNTFRLSLESKIILGGYCNRYTTFSSNSQIGQFDGIYLAYTAFIYITDSRFNDLNAFKAYLAKNPVKIIVNYKDLQNEYLNDCDISKFNTRVNYNYIQAEELNFSYYFNKKNQALIEEDDLTSPVWFKKETPITTSTSYNLFNFNRNPEYIYMNTEYEKKESSIIIKDNSANSSWSLLEYYVSNLKPNTTYTLSAFITVKEGASRMTICQERDTVSNITILKEVVDASGQISFSFTTKDDVDNLALILYSNRGTTPEVVSPEVEYSNIMIYEGVEELPFQPHESNELIIRQENEQGEINTQKITLKQPFYGSEKISNLFSLKDNTISIVKNLDEFAVTSGQFMYYGDISLFIVTIPNKIYGTTTNYLMSDSASFSGATKNFGELYENPANVVFVGSQYDTAETMYQKYVGSKIIYVRKEPEIDVYVGQPIYADSGNGKISVMSPVDSPVNVTYIQEQLIEPEFVLEGSNLVFDSKFFFDNDVSLENTTFDSSKIINDSQPIYLYNSGSKSADLSMTFDFVEVTEGQPLTILINKVKMLNDGWQDAGVVSQLTLTHFDNYKPYQDLITKYYSSQRTTTLPTGWQNDWQLEINSTLKEIYFKNKHDDSYIISLNAYNIEQDFLHLESSNFVDYSLAFPTLRTEVEESAIKDTYFNQLYLSSNNSYGLKNVELKWKHTYY